MAKGYEWPDDGRDWIDANEAGPLLGIGARYVPAWARHRGLEIWQPGGRYGRVMLLRKEVESLGELGKLHRRWKAKHDAFGGKRRSDKMPEAQAKAIFCDVREAAGILGVTTKAVHRLVAKGRVVPYQSAPRQRGSRLWFSRRTLELLREDREWQKRRERGVNSSRGIASDRALAQAKWERGEWLDTEGAVGRKAYVQSHTESGVDVRWISGNEAAALMGVGMGRLNQWRHSGRLEGQKIGTKPGRGRWHYREFDIGEWMAKPDYQRARAGWEGREKARKADQTTGNTGEKGKEGTGTKVEKWRTTGNGKWGAVWRYGQWARDAGATTMPDAVTLVGVAVVSPGQGIMTRA